MNPKTVVPTTLPWPRSTAMFLLMVGGLLGLVSLLVVLWMPDLSVSGVEDAPSHELAAAYLGTGPLTAWLATMPGVLKPVQAVLIALPLVWLPLAVARIFRRARAGYALVLLPPIMWLLNNGTILIGTEYGLADVTSPLRVSALQGIPASLLFLSLSLVLLLSTARLSSGQLLAASLGLVVVDLVAELAMPFAGVAGALAIGVLWRSALRGRARLLGALLVSTITAALTVLLAQPLAQILPPVGAPGEVPVSPAGWSDSLSRTLFVVKQFGAPFAFVLVGFILSMTRRTDQRRAIGAALAIAAPAVVIGVVVPVATGPSLYAYGVLSAALGLLVAVALGGIVWSVTSMPAHVRATERERLSGRLADQWARGEHTGISAVVPTRNGEQVIVGTVEALASRLGSDDEVVVVENGSSDGTVAVLEELSSRWNHPAKLVLLHSDPGLGEALRTGALASRGGRLLLTADDLPFGFTDLDEFLGLPDDVLVAIGSKAHPDSNVQRHRRRTLQSKIFRFLREALLQSRVGDSQGTIWVDGNWGRAFALHSRETGLMWTTELVLAAEQQGVAVREVPVQLHETHEAGSSRFRFADAWRSVVGFFRLAVYKDDYCDENWATPVAPVRPGDPVR